MYVDILTCSPKWFDHFKVHTLIKRALQKKLLTLQIYNLHDWSTNKHHKVDDTIYGGGSGMLLKPEPIANCIEMLTQKNTYQDIIYMAPEGMLLNQKMVNQAALYERVMILCGHYQGIDERIKELYITKMISIGPYILSGGELASMIWLDSVTRLIPGVLEDPTTALQDSFQDDLISPPHYTKPAKFKNKLVPEVLRSGNQQAINEWRLEQSLERTKQFRKRNKL